jgi:hypothetical protein
LKLPEYTTKGNESSYSGTALDSGGSDVEDVTHSDPESEYVPSETSEDREFVVSDSESLSGVSIESLDPNGSGYTILNDEIGDVATVSQHPFRRDTDFDIFFKNRVFKASKPSKQSPKGP